LSNSKPAICVFVDTILYSFFETPPTESFGMLSIFFFHYTITWKLPDNQS